MTNWRTYKLPKDAVDPYGDPTVIKTELEGIKGAYRRQGYEQHRLTYLGQIQPADPFRDLDATSVFQIAARSILQSQRLYRHNLNKIVKNGEIDGEEFKWQKVIFDMPRIGEKPVLPMAVILATGACNYTSQSDITNLLDETVDKYGDGTVLRRLGNAVQDITIHSISAHHEERRAIKKAWEQDFLAEPNILLTGRRVTVEQYYDREVRMNLKSIEYPETEQGTLENAHVCVATFEMEVEVVRLVTRPTNIEPPITNITVT